MGKGCHKQASFVKRNTYIVLPLLPSSSWTSISSLVQILWPHASNLGVFGGQNKIKGLQNKSLKFKTTQLLLIWNVNIKEAQVFIEDWPYNRFHKFSEKIMDKSQFWTNKQISNKMLLIFCFVYSFAWSDHADCWINVFLL